VRRGVSLMRNSDYQDILKNDLLEPIMELTEKKAADYATEGNTLQNFITVSKLCEVLHIDPAKSPSEAALFFQVIKLSRLCNLRGRAPKNESLLDTCRDYINYIGLWYACYKEENSEPNTVSMPIEKGETK
jgi:hypothetical protein